MIRPIVHAAPHVAGQCGRARHASKCRLCLGFTEGHRGRHAPQQLAHFRVEFQGLYLLNPVVQQSYPVPVPVELGVVGEVVDLLVRVLRVLLGLEGRSHERKGLEDVVRGGGATLRRAERVVLGQ